MQIQRTRQDRFLSSNSDSTCNNDSNGKLCETYNLTSTWHAYTSIYKHVVAGPVPLHSVNPPIAVPPPLFPTIPPPCTTTAPHHDGHSVHVVQPSRAQQQPQTSQPPPQQHSHNSSHPAPSFSRDRVHVEKSPRMSGTPPGGQSHQRHGNAQASQQQNTPTQVKTEPAEATTVKKEPKDKVEETTERITPNRNRQSTDTPARAGPVKRERASSEHAEDVSPSPLTEEEDKKPPAKKTKEEDAATSWRTFYNADLARQKEAELNLDIDPEMRDLVAQSLTLENKLVAELIKMKTAAALVAVQENEVCICNAKIQSLREMRNDLENRQSRLMAPAVVTMPDLNSRA
ncbi:unnamed protein product [Cylicostephanus goldi]|uniref:Uncharacterized protein n=1 Tax=Cylicostephanus goldi TaxID=71465 RepID=A0A3P6RH66_CYLGO|nr:unnamed protein product [Cylicostephanus goldi]